jgi:hypothetical protein
MLTIPTTATQILLWIPHIFYERYTVKLCVNLWTHTLGTFHCYIYETPLWWSSEAKTSQKLINKIYLLFIPLMNAAASYLNMSTVWHTAISWTIPVDPLNIQKVCSSTKRNLHVGQLIILNTCIILTSQLCKWTLFPPITFSCNCTSPRIRPCLKWNYIKIACKSEKIHAIIQVTSDIYIWHKKHTKKVPFLVPMMPWPKGTLFLWPKT